MSAPIKMRLQAKNRIPHGGGWNIVDPLTGVRIFAVTWDMLVNKVREERRANGAPIGLELEEEIEGWCCIAHPEEAQVVDERMPRRRAFNLDDIVRGTKTILAFKLAGSPVVSQEEAERRAAICVRCQLNLGWSQNCSVCNNLADIVQPIIGQRRTSRDQELFACNICGCSNKAQIHLPLDILNKSLTPEMKEQFRFANEAFSCWHRVDSEQQQA